jgi:excisionase family DNA binding protein
MVQEFLNLQDAAKFLCVSTSKLYKMTHKNEIRYYKIGRLNVFRIEELQDYVRSNMVLTCSDLKARAQARVVSANNPKEKSFERA